MLPAASPALCMDLGHRREELRVEVEVLGFAASE
jgi:hypothetical protein